MGILVENLHVSTIEYLTAWTSSLWIEAFNEMTQSVLDETGEGIGEFAATSRKCFVVESLDQFVPDHLKHIKVCMIQEHINNKSLFQLLIIPCYRPQAGNLEEADFTNHSCIKYCTIDQLTKNWFEMYRSNDPY